MEGRALPKIFFKSRFDLLPSSKITHLNTNPKFLALKENNIDCKQQHANYNQLVEKIKG